MVRKPNHKRTSTTNVIDVGHAPRAHACEPMNEIESDKVKLALILATKESWRSAQRAQTWEERVAAISRMNVVNKLAKLAMLSSSSDSNSNLHDELQSQTFKRVRP